ncbi:MoaF-related domain-containing protein [Niastella vici]|nr:MoaF N-terminal domain-containing protein [Niastella vici]
MPKFIAAAITIMLLIAACHTNNTGNTAPTGKDTLVAPTEIIGKTGFIAFPGGVKVEENFLSDTTLHWKYTDANGTATQEDEHISYKKINDSLYFINWIEKSGLTVSQILDLKKGTATAFTSRFDEKSDRGQRSSLFLEGSFEVK